MVDNDMLSCAVQISNTSVFQRTGKSAKTDQSGKNLSQGFFKINYYYCYYYFGCIGSQLPHVGSLLRHAGSFAARGLSVWRADSVIVHVGTRAHWLQWLQHAGPRAVAHGVWSAQAQQLWHMGSLIVSHRPQCVGTFRSCSAWALVALSRVLWNLRAQQLWLMGNQHSKFSSQHSS